MQCFYFLVTFRGVVKSNMKVGGPTKTAGNQNTSSIYSSMPSAQLLSFYVRYPSNNANINVVFVVKNYECAVFF